MKKILTSLVLLIGLHTMTMAQYGRYNNNRNNNKYKKQLRRVYAAQNGVIFGNTTIKPDNNYYSQDKRYYFRFQSDGNLVVARTSDEKSLWASGTDRRGVTCYFQGDANLVIKDASGTDIFNAFGDQANKNLPQTATESTVFMNQRKGRNALVMQNDGNLVIYSGPSHVVKWATDTAGR